MKSTEVESRYARAVADALTAFPITVRSVELVNISENVTWRVTDDAARHYVLRLHRPGYHTLDELISERAWIRALAAAGVAVPQGILTRTAEEYATVRVPATGEQRHAGLAHWTAGEVLAEVLDRDAGPLDDPQSIDRWFVQLGTLIAELHDQASHWAPPAGFTRHALDADGLMGEQPFWGRFWEHPSLSGAESALLARARSRLHQTLSNFPRTPDSYSVIHADLHSGNLLVNDGTLTVIDFDDAGFGWHLYDLAVALRPYHDRPAYPQVQDAVLRGYRLRRPLSDEAAALLPMFMLIRRLATVGWVMQRPELKVELERDDIEQMCGDIDAFLGSDPRV